MLPRLCREADLWLNDPEVRKAIHAAPLDVTGPWTICSDRILYTADAGSMLPIHKQLTRKRGARQRLLQLLASFQYSSREMLLLRLRQWLQPVEAVALHECQTAGTTAAPGMHFHLIVCLAGRQHAAHPQAAHSQARCVAKWLLQQR
jgi:hypothetical protein